MKPKNDVLLVQVRDREGFWCNAAEFTGSDTLRHAKLYAKDWTAQHSQTTRLVRGHNREVLQSFAPALDASEP